MNRARFALLVPVVVVLAACGGPQVPPSQNYPTIRGRAYDSATNQPVAGVGVTVSTILTATTGADGTYRSGARIRSSAGASGFSALTTMTPGEERRESHWMSP